MVDDKEAKKIEGLTINAALDKEKGSPGHQERRQEMGHCERRRGSYGNDLP